LAGDDVVEELDCVVAEAMATPPRDRPTAEAMAAVRVLIMSGEWTGTLG
jgi:hypothetical protein